MATAISGSGPGFVFNLIDAMENAATNLGFKKDEAKILVSQTFRGSINLLINKNIINIFLKCTSCLCIYCNWARDFRDDSKSKSHFSRYFTFIYIHRSTWYD